MQEKYTEDIDKLDAFYQDALQEASIEPPAHLWDKISMANEKEKPKGFYLKRSTLILLLLLCLLSVSGLVVYLGKDKTPEAPEKNLPEHYNQPNTPAAPDHLDKNSSEKENLNATNTVKNISGNPNQTKAIVPVTNDSLTATSRPATTETTKTPEITKAPKDSIVTTPVEAPKKKLSFREKHKQEANKDSLRPLFVPIK